MPLGQGEWGGPNTHELGGCPPDADNLAGFDRLTLFHTSLPPPLTVPAAPPLASWVFCFALLFFIFDGVSRLWRHDHRRRSVHILGTLDFSHFVLGESLTTWAVVTSIWRKT